MSKAILFDKTFYFLLLEIYGKSFIIRKEKTKEEIMESKFYEKDKLLIFKITDEIDDCSVQKIRRKADYEMEREREKSRNPSICWSCGLAPVMVV